MGLLVADVEGAHSYVDFERSGAGACVVFADDEVTVVTAGPVIVERAHSNVYFHLRVVSVFMQNELHVAHSDVDLTASCAADGVEVQVAAVEIEYLLESGPIGRVRVTVAWAPLGGIGAGWRRCWAGCGGCECSQSWDDWQRIYSKIRCLGGYGDLREINSNSRGVRGDRDRSPRD